ncbi:hypothetical protein LTS10_009753 [Elasticomyces elasticus]|nr:hypothetical protein LTS10_009753 [Elasticomyces elasticus]
MPPLPDDVLLIIFGHTDIDTFLDVRRLNHHIHGLVQSHIHGLTESVARSTFPGQTRILEYIPDKDTASHADCLYWLKDLRFQQLAAILLECVGSFGVAAEDPLGDELRHSVADSWRIIADCSKIAEQVANIEENQLPPRQDASAAAEWTNGGITPSLRELELCRQYLQYFEGLALEQLTRYTWLLRDLNQYVFCFPNWFPSRAQRGQRDRPGNKDCELWVCSHILKLGAEPFWRSWWSTDPLQKHHEYSVKAAVDAAWLGRDELTRQSERYMYIAIEFQIVQINERVTYELQVSPRYQTRRSDVFDGLYGNVPLHDIRVKREALLAEGEAPTPSTFVDLPFKQALDPAVIGRTPVPESDWPEPPGRERHRYYTSCGFSLPKDRRTQISEKLRGFSGVYEEWERGWEERKGWETQAALVEKRMAQVLDT